jgi:hypothetical protein
MHQVCLRGPVLALLVSGTVLLPGLGAAWSVTTIGMMGPFPDLSDEARDIAVGDGDADGTSEIYVAANAGVAQFSWNGSAWNRVFLQIGSADSVAIGDGDRDGKPEVWAGMADGLVRQLLWNVTGKFWHNGKIVKLDTETHGIHTITVGDADRDGLKEVYAGNLTSVWRIWFSGGNWHKAEIVKLQSMPSASWIGNGDGTNGSELYLGTDAGSIVQVQRSGPAWAKKLIGQVCCEVTGVAIGHTMGGSGKPQVHAVSLDRHLYRLEWTGSSWVKKTIMTFAERLGDVTIAVPGTIGGPIGNRVPTMFIAQLDDGHAYEVRWNGAAWVRTDMGYTLYGLTTIAAGDADNDGILDVSAAAQQGTVHWFQP